LDRYVVKPKEWYPSEFDRILEYEEQREQNWHRKERRQTPCQPRERAYPGVVIHFHDRFSLLHRILVFLLSCGKLRLQFLHPQTRTHCTLVERPKGQSHENSKDYQHPAI